MFSLMCSFLFIPLCYQTAKVTFNVIQRHCMYGAIRQATYDFLN